MILSASRRTDIPAWHVDWLLEGLHAGHVNVPNPYNPKQISKISLRPDDMDAVFFWTRDIRPMLPHLDAGPLATLRSVFLYTITGYGPLLEPRIPDAEAAVGALRALADRVGAARVVWRYDPVLLGDERFSPDSHRARFRALARSMAGSTTRVVISLVDWYRKTSAAMSPFLSGGEAPRVLPLEAVDPLILGLIPDLREIAEEHGIEAAGCCEPEWHERGILPRGACIDRALVATLWGLTITDRRDPGQRDSCRCAPSRDIGLYDTCRGGCRYCYATLASGRASP